MITNPPSKIPKEVNEKARLINRGNQYLRHKRSLARTCEADLADLLFLIERHFHIDDTAFTDQPHTGLSLPIAFQDIATAQLAILDTHRLQLALDLLALQ